MKLKTLAVFTVCGLIFSVALTAAEKETGIGGKWVTEAVATAVRKKEPVPNAWTDLVLRSWPCDSAGGFGGGGGRSRNGQGGFGGGQGGFGGGCQNPGQAVVIDKGVGGPAVLMDLQADKTRVKGTVISDYVKNETGDISEGKVTGTKFHFVLTKKVADIKIATNYDGELVDANTITLVRTLTGGKPVDKKSDGTAETLTFHRVE